MFDTLRFADRLKDSGFENQQAEGLARALGDEFDNVVAHVATKSHFDSEIGAVRSEIGTLSERFDALDYKVDAMGARIDALDCKVDAMGARIDAKVDALDYKVDAMGARIDAKVDALDYKVDALDGKLGARIDSLGTQLRFVFAMMALLLALGLVDTVPRILG